MQPNRRQRKHKTKSFAVGAKGERLQWTKPVPKFLQHYVGTPSQQREEEEEDRERIREAEERAREEAEAIEAKLAAERHREEEEREKKEAEEEEREKKEAEDREREQEEREGVHKFRKPTQPHLRSRKRKADALSTPQDSKSVPSQPSQPSRARKTQTALLSFGDSL
jgi:hypothetical protein